MPAIPKRTIFALAVAISALIVGFIAKETIFFDSDNPYGAKEISPEFAQSLPVVKTAELKPSNFNSSHAGPLEDHIAERVCLEYASANLEGLDISPSELRIKALASEGAGRIYQILDSHDTPVAIVRMDRLGGLSLQIP